MCVCVCVCVCMSSIILLCIHTYEVKLMLLDCLDVLIMLYFTYLLCCILFYLLCCILSLFIFVVFVVSAGKIQAIVDVINKFDFAPLIASFTKKLSIHGPT